MGSIDDILQFIVAIVLVIIFFYFILPQFAETVSTAVTWISLWIKFIGTLLLLVILAAILKIFNKVI
jgi:hypothetical protein